VAEHAVDGLEVLFGLIVELFGLLLELLEAPLGVDVDGVLGVLADIEPGSELLRRLQNHSHQS
jgi:hypothetical protein